MNATESLNNGIMQKCCCATCKHRHPLGASIHYLCIGCIQDGECTKWEHAGGDTDDDSGQ